MNPNQEQNALLKFGVVSATDPDTAKVRVKFADLDNLETAFIPVALAKTQRDKSYWMPDVGEHVACLMDANAETGLVLSAIYSEADAPPISSQDKRHVRFDDGTTVEYDRAEHKLTINCVGDVKVVTQGDVEVAAQGDVRVAAGGNAEVRAQGFAQYVANGPLLVKSNTLLTLKGPTSRIDL